MTAAEIPQAVLAERFAAQLLAGTPATSTLAVAHRLLAIQAQDPRGARLAIRARSHGLTAADVDAALTAGSVVVTWFNRGTLHLVAAEDYWWLHALTAPRLATGNARRLAQEGVPPDHAERGVSVIERAVTAEGPLTRAQLAERITAAGVRAEGQAIVHLLALACLRQSVVRGPMAGREQAYVLVKDWLEPAPCQFDRDRTLAELAVRFLAGHGPASDRDLAQWAGLPLGDARRGLAAVAGRLTEAGAGLTALASAAGQQAGIPPPRLLGAYDPLLLGWSSREPVVGGHGPRITVNGLFRPFALVGGQAAGVWSMPGGRVELAPFAPLPEAAAAALAADAAEVERFLAARPGTTG